MEQILSDPLWNKMRLKAVSAFPDDLELWKEFYSVWAVNRKESFRFYADNKEQLEKGAKYEPVIFNQNNYPTALAFLMTEYLRKPAVFVSERQNDPSAFASGDASNYKIDERILHNCKIDKLPEQFDCISAGVDVHDDVLFYSVIGKQAETFYLLKIGVFPDQQIQEKSAMTPMSVFYPANPLTNSLNTLLDGLEKFSISGTAMPPKLILVDRGYRSDLIANIAAKRRTIFTCKGYAPSANQQPIAEWTRRSIVAKGSFYALNLNEIKNWYHIETPLVKEQLAAAINGGQFRIYEKCYCPALIEHFTCEVPEVREALYKRTVWTPQHNENHLWDTAVYALSAAMISEGSMIQDGIIQMKRQKINVNF
ncbi:hypothetical protein FACS18942_09910 [Planctomycetales bacterium]|nr:hypothetical protein FACS18942_09910 [Planctomycetales bacterium]